MRVAGEAGSIPTSEIVTPFVFASPTRIVCGMGSASGVGEILAQASAQAPFLVTDRTLVAAGLHSTILESCRSAGLKEPVIFEDVPSDSDREAVRRAAELSLKSGCDSVVAVGGGSVIDTAKVAAIGMTFGGDVMDFEGMNVLTAPLKPLVAVPTTAGTGSEVSSVAMIKDGERKAVFGGRYMYPNTAVLDPCLIVSLPPRLTAATGMDALTHSIESLVAVGSNAASDALSLEALRLIFGFLPRATAHGDDLDARSATLVASTLAGLAFSNAGVGVVHALAHTIGGRYGTHHGMTNAVFLPHGMRFNLEPAAAKLARAGRYLAAASGTPFPVSSDERAAEELILQVEELMRQCRSAARLRDLDIPPLCDSDLEELAETALTDAAIIFNPRQATSDDLVQLLREAY